MNRNEEEKIMTHHTFVEKKLHLRFKGSDKKTKNLIISRPKDKLKKDSANIAMGEYYRS